MDRRVKIMVVEDDEVLAKEICLFLEKWGYELVLAREFSDIIGEFAAHRPQLILLDINLPYYDGFYWCSQIRQISDVPSFLSAAAMMTGIRLWRLPRVETIMWKNRFGWNC